MPISESACGLRNSMHHPGNAGLLIFSILYGVWAANFVAFNGHLLCELSAQFLALAEKQGATIPLVVGHRLMGISLAWTGDIAEGRAHYDQGVVLYDPAVHRPLATRFGQDAGGVNPMPSVDGAVVAWLSRRRARRRKASAPGSARHRPSYHFDVCPVLHKCDPNFLRELRDRNEGTR